MNLTDFLSRFQNPHKSGTGWTVRCPAHEDKQASLSIMAGEKGIVCKCFAGCTVQSIAGALGIKVADLFYEAKDAAKKAPRAELKEVCTYPYVDRYGAKLYEVVRYEPKTFRQRHMVDGQWSWSMEGVTRVPYRLDALTEAATVYMCEGEKDADTLAAQGYVATTTCGGASGWLDAYAEYFTDKNLIICPDQDEAGREYGKRIAESCAMVAKTIKMVNVGAKDVSDFFKLPAAKKRFDDLVADAPELTKGVYVPVFSSHELEARYALFQDRNKERSFSLGKWLPSLSYYRDLVPGEVLTIMADTGVGKTAAAQCICQAARPLKCLIFSMELPETSIFERQHAIAENIRCEVIEREFKEGGRTSTESWNHIFVCAESGLSIAAIEKIIMQSELKIGSPPELVVVDYIQLMSGQGSRRERFSDAAEQLKVLAKRVNTRMVLLSQIHRKPEEETEIYLHDAKETGSIENSSGMLLGLFRDEEDTTGATMVVKVLKCTKGKAGRRIICNFAGDPPRITERSSRIDEQERQEPSERQTDML